MRKEEVRSICCKSAMELNSELQYSEKNIIDLKTLTYEILDSIIDSITFKL